MSGIRIVGSVSEAGVPMEMLHETQQHITTLSTVLVRKYIFWRGAA